MTKISALSDIGTSVASNDTFVLVDVSDPTTPNKKIQQQNLFLIPDGSAGTPAVRFLNDTDVGLFRPTTNTLALATGGSERLRIDSSGRVGIGTSSPSSILHLATETGVSSELRLSNPANNWSVKTGTSANSFSIVENQFGGTPLFINSSLQVGIGTTSPNQPLEVNGVIRGGSYQFSTSSTTTAEYLGFSNSNGPTLEFWGSASANAGSFLIKTAGTERARIDSSGRLLVGTSSTSAAVNLLVAGGDGARGVVNIASTAATPADGDDLGFVSFNDSAHIYNCALIRAQRDGGTWTATTSKPTRLMFSTTADGASSPTERMRINSSGSVRIGGTGDPGAIHVIQQPGIAIGTQVLSIQGSQDSVRVYDASDFANPNGATTVLWVRANNSTSRSINAAGTVNASGADYAEYMNKAGDFVIAKGDICGINSGGNLTAIFDEAIGFLVKSTNPSYVGGDTWGAGFDGDPDGLEAARQKVDRIAFAGQVPVNVMGASPGQYIVPVKAANGGIEGVAKNEADLTLAEYMRAVGKVIAIEDDGRARIIVKVA